MNGTLLTSELAEACGLLYSTVDRYCRRGYLDGFTLEPARGSGSRRRFHPTARRALLALAAFPPRRCNSGGSPSTDQIRWAIAEAMESMPTAGAVLVWRHPDEGDRFCATPFGSPLTALHVAFDYEICGTVLCLDRLEQLAEESRP